MRIKETEYWEVVLSKNQYYLGYSIINLKRACENLSGLKQEEILDFFDIVVWFEKRLKEVFGASMFNWSCLMNNSYKSEEIPAQVHWHARPRYKNKVEFAGEVFVDEVFAHHYDKNKTKFVSEDILNEIANEIK